MDFSQSDTNQDSLICYGLRIYYVFFCFYCLVSQYSLCTHIQTYMLFAPHCANKALNLALELNLGLLLCVATADAGNPVKSIMIIIITEAPWRREDAVYHNSPSIFPAGLFSPDRPVTVRWL